MAPMLSVARAVKTWLPTGTFRHVKEYGAVLSWPTRVVPSRNSTLVTVPSESVAVAVILIVGFQGKIAPSMGDVMLTAGGVLVLLATVILDAALVAVSPTSSVARAVSV